MGACGATGEPGSGVQVCKELRKLWSLGSGLALRDGGSDVRGFGAHGVVEDLGSVVLECTERQGLQGLGWD